MLEAADRILERAGLARHLAHRRLCEGVEARHAEPERPLPGRLREALESHGIPGLFTHQAHGLDRVRAGRDVVVVTPTASGKTLLFALAVLESWLADPRSKALFLYPTKALAQDQLAGLRQLAGGLGALAPPRFEIFDGDTPAGERRRIKADPPQVLITNPDMLHAGILAHHGDWAPFLRDLRFVVLDEMHVYRGIFGTHVHHILGRLLRIAARHGAEPRFVAASATVGNPAEFAGRLVGRPFEVVSESGASRAPIEVLFLNPTGLSPYTAAVRLVAAAIDEELRTIAFTKARRVTELLYTWLCQQRPELRSRVASYRAGYLPEERRAIEGRLFRGELSAVLTTSALELGIDVGGLDACVLVGYPGSLISSWQRIGRVGRQGRPGVVFLLAMPDSLDQYVVHHPELFFGRSFERAVLDPWNPTVAGQHLVCASAEAPLERREIEARGEKGVELVSSLTEEGRLVQDALGERWFSFRRRPHRDVNPRSAGEPFAILERRREAHRLLGRIDGVRVYHECHPGAIYLHAGRTYRIEDLDRDRRRVIATEERADHYTVVLAEKETAILEHRACRKVQRFAVGLGRLQVTVRIHGYQRRRLFGGEPISNHPLDLPPLVYETVGFWIELPPALEPLYAGRGLHFMGGIHATEHAMIGLFPLLAIADRGDVGGISYTGHAQLGGPAIFLYDGVAGGAGLAEQGFFGLETLLGRTAELVAGCACEEGCPACIQSAQCGNGNRPLDKEAALLTLRCLTGEVPLGSLGVEPVEAALPSPLSVRSAPERPRLDAGRRHGVRRGGNVEPDTSRILFLDVETQRSAAEVGGWAHIDQMGLALAVVYDRDQGVFRTYHEADIHRLLLDLVMADRVVGFNIDRFDLAVLSAYTDWDLDRIRTLDLLAEIHARLGFRVSLRHLTELNLGESKAGDGEQSLAWWKAGRIDLIEQYCRKDVEITRQLFELGRGQGFLLYRDHEERAMRVPVRW